jgi:hypothetical protein
MLENCIFCDAAFLHYGMYKFARASAYIRIQRQLVRVPLSHAKHIQETLLTTHMVPVHTSCSHGHLCTLIVQVFLKHSRSAEYAGWGTSILAIEKFVAFNVIGTFSAAEQTCWERPHWAIRYSRYIAWGTAR